jgi:RNA polymerase sigma-54 factor
MELTQSASLRMDQRQLLTPRMIQSMEILQLPLAALEERIEQELQNNPVLELREGEADNGDGGGEDVVAENAAENAEAREDFSESEQLLVLKENNGAEDFDRLEKISEYLDNEEYAAGGRLNHRVSSSFDGERDKKLDALNNTAARSGNLTEHLLDQWRFVEAPAGVKRAGEILISYVNAEGYLAIDLETIQRESTKVPLMYSLGAGSLVIWISYFPVSSSR